MERINSTHLTESELKVCFESDSPKFGSVYEAKIGTATYYFKIIQIINGHYVTAQEVGSRSYLKSKRSGSDLMEVAVKEVKAKGKIKNILKRSRMI